MSTETFVYNKRDEEKASQKGKQKEKASFLAAALLGEAKKQQKSEKQRP